MNFVEVLLLVTNLFIGITVLWCCYLALESMDGKTKHGIRFTYYGMCLCGFAMLIIPIWREWWLMPFVQALLGICFALYLLIDRRRIDKIKRDLEETIPFGKLAKW